MKFSYEDLSTVYYALCDSVHVQKNKLNEVAMLNADDTNSGVLAAMRATFSSTENLRRIIGDRLTAMERSMDGKLIQPEGNV
jgi:hypothetical protein